jgi:hypothetical protein
MFEIGYHHKLIFDDNIKMKDGFLVHM